MALPPLALALVALTGAFVALARAWPDDLPSWRVLALPVAGLSLSLWSSATPLAPTRHLAALRADPYQLWDAPGAALADLAAWPLARLLGDAAAVLLVGALARALALVLVHALARAVVADGATAYLAQAVLLLAPAPAAATALGQTPALVAQALVLLLLAHLARRFAHLDGARDAGAAFLVLLLAQAAGREPLRDVVVLVPTFAVLALAAGEGRRARRLLAAEAIALTVIGVLLYGKDLPGLWHDAVRPAPSASAIALVAATGLAPLLFLPAGLRAIESGSAPGRLLLRAALLAGALRVLGGAPETSLLVGPLAVCAAAGFLRSWRGAQTGASAVQAVT